MSEEGLRRSTRVRKQVKSYATEQAEEAEQTFSAPPQKRKKKQPILDNDECDHDAEYNGDAEASTSGPAKKAKRKKPKSSDQDGEARADGLTKKGFISLLQM